MAGTQTTQTEGDFEQMSWHDCNIWRLDFMVGDSDEGDWTDDLVDRKRRPDAAIGPGCVGAGELCSPKPVAGGAEPFQGSAVYRRPSSPR